MKLFEYFQFIFFFILLVVIILIDISVIVFIIAYFFDVPFAIEFNSYLTEYRGTIRGVSYSNGAFLISVLLIQIPILPRLVKKLKEIKL